jgi:hypothetical protein
MPEELEYVQRRPREYESPHAKLDQTKRGRAPPRPRPPMEVDRVHTPASANAVFHALRRVWNPAFMRGPASQQAICVLLGQWGVETFHDGKDGQACHNWNLAGIKAGQPDKQAHYRMFTPDDMPAKQAEALVAHHKRLRPDDPQVLFKDDKNLAAPGKLRVWQIACFRSSETLDDGARLFIGLIARFTAALAHMHAGEPEKYAHAISDEVMGKDKGWFNAPSVAYQKGMRVRFNRYVKMTF